MHNMQAKQRNKMPKGFHDQEFSESTKVKLELLEYSFMEWLPVFIMTPFHGSQINVFDLFAGPGQDGAGNSGSPKILIDTIVKYRDQLFSKNLAVNLYLNEWNKNPSKNNFEKLCEFLDDQKLDDVPIVVHRYSKPFQEIFPLLYPLMEPKEAANYLFLDQFGIKEISIDVFRMITLLNQTDTLFFISSSFFLRFAERPEFRKYHQISKQKLSNDDYLNVHKGVVDYYRDQIPPGRRYYLSPFSLKKESSNIFGLVFGSSELRGIEKFLIGCWKLDGLRGEANFDIDRENILEDQLTVFGDTDRPKKLSIFEEDLERKILSREIIDNKGLYEYAITQGFLPNHAKAAFNKMVKTGKLPKQTIGLSYTSIKRKPKNIKVI